MHCMNQCFYSSGAEKLSELGDCNGVHSWSTALHTACCTKYVAITLQNLDYLLYRL